MGTDRAKYTAASAASTTAAAAGEGRRALHRRGQAEEAADEGEASFQALCARHAAARRAQEVPDTTLARWRAAGWALASSSLMSAVAVPRDRKNVVTRTNARMPRTLGRTAAAADDDHAHGKEDIAAKAWVLSPASR